MRIWVRMRSGVRVERGEGGEGRRRGICDLEVRWPVEDLIGEICGRRSRAHRTCYRGRISMVDLISSGPKSRRANVWIS